MKQIEYNIAVDYQSRSEILPMEAPEDYLSPINIKVVGVRETHPYNEVILGVGQAIRIRVSRADQDDEYLHSVFDSEADLLKLGTALYTADFIGYRPGVSKQFPDRFPSEDLLFIRHLTLQPEYRGQKVGLSVMHRLLLDLSDGCGFVVAKPYPIGSGNVNPGRDKLRRYWERVDFQRIARSAFWAVDADSPVPSATELGLPTSIFLNDQSNES